MRAPNLARAALAALFAFCLSVGLTAAFAPRAFYDDFPFFAHWVRLLPPYNEHLVTDVGGLYLGFALLFAFAARRLERSLTVAASAGFLVVVVLHLAFHASHLGGYGAADAIAQLATLAALLLPLAAAIWGTAAPPVHSPASSSR